METMVIREAVVNYRPSKRVKMIGDGGALRSPYQAQSIFRLMLTDNSREHFLALYLDSQNSPIAYSVVTIGVETQSLITPTALFQKAFLLGACSVMVAHNHPSGSITPSKEDDQVTDKLKKAGELLGVKLLDHIILGNADNYYSFVEQTAF